MTELARDILYSAEEGLQQSCFARATIAGDMKNEWTWKQELKEQAKLFWAEFLHQVFGYPLSPLRRHILTERAKMTRKLWLYVMYRDRWRCQIHSPVCTGKAEEVDHIKALANWGYTQEQNLQAACHACNRWKGTR